jgi:hypothetical protein
MSAANRIFTAISREDVNIIAIAQGSSELTISIVVRRDGLEKAVRAVHAECHLQAWETASGIGISDPETPNQRHIDAGAPISTMFLKRRSCIHDIQPRVRL